MSLFAASLLFSESVINIQYAQSSNNKWSKKEVSREEALDIGKHLRKYVEDIRSDSQLLSPGKGCGLDQGLFYDFGILLFLTDPV